MTVSTGWPISRAAKTYSGERRCLPFPENGTRGNIELAIGDAGAIGWE